MDRHRHDRRRSQSPENGSRHCKPSDLRAEAKGLLREVAQQNGRLASFAAVWAWGGILHFYAEGGPPGGGPGAGGGGPNGGTGGPGGRRPPSGRGPRLPGGPDPGSPGSAWPSAGSRICGRAGRRRICAGRSWSGRHWASMRRRSIPSRSGRWPSRPFPGGADLPPMITLRRGSVSPPLLMWIDISGTGRQLFCLYLPEAGWPTKP